MQFTSSQPIAQPIARPIIGMDIAKSIFQLHTVDPDTGEIERFKLKRARVLEFFANRRVSLVAIEACGGAHHWARELVKLGHLVKLIPAQAVRPFVQRDKTDAKDALGIWVAAAQPHIRAVPVKSEQSQACLGLHSLRGQLMKMRIMQTNALRGLLYEFGIVLPEGHNALLDKLPGALAAAEQAGTVPQVLAAAVLEQLQRVHSLQRDIDLFDKRIAALIKTNQQMQTLQAIPGIGPLTASALVASVADMASFESSRQFAAWVGLTPRQTGTGGKIRQLGLSKRGDVYLRTMLMHGARAVVARATHSSWLVKLLERRPYNVAVAAVANKLARTAWAVLAKGRAFDPLKWHPTEQMPTMPATMPA